MTEGWKLLWRRPASFSSPVPEFINSVFGKTSPKRSFSVMQNERLGLVFAKTGSINLGTGFPSIKKTPIYPCLLSPSHPKSIEEENRTDPLWTSHFTAYSCLIWNHYWTAVYTEDTSSRTETHKESLIRCDNKSLEFIIESVHFIKAENHVGFYESSEIIKSIKLKPHSVSSFPGPSLFEYLSPSHFHSSFSLALILDSNSWF